MPKSRPYARIAITLPEEDLAAADRLAAEQDRSRSWIIAEALRQYAATRELDPYRRAQLEHDLTLTPEARVHIAEATAQQTAGASGPQVFATYDEFRAARRAGWPPA